MKTFLAAFLPVVLLTAMSCAQQDQQAAPPPGDQSSYPSTTHKMTPAEKKDTPSANGQPVDLNSASKKDLAALPGVGPDYAQTIIDARPFSSKEDLLKKKVIPQSTYDKIQDRVTTQGPKKQSLPEGPKH
ncbi:MAG: DNA-binding protein [Candidatus Sulfotelmatobacter sp.]|nr:DNA-binding protein [Candidatus Sulfotelmatobacter sp.]